MLKIIINRNFILFSSSGVVNCLSFDATGEFLLAAVDKQIKIFRNIPAYRAAIESSKLKLKQKQSSATQERIEKIIIEKTQFLKSMGEPLVCQLN